jgi:hypothetical protein
MASPVKLYQTEMHDNLGFFPTWLPGDPIDAGDVGVLEGGRFRKLTSLHELGMDCPIEESGVTQDVKYTATHGTSLNTSAGAGVAAVAKVEIKVEFSREGAFVFHASGLRQRSLQGRAMLGERLQPMLERGAWKKKWLLIESCYVAERATILVSEESSAGVSLRAASDIPLSGIALADPKVSLEVTGTRGRVVQVVGAPGVRPLYSCLRLTTGFFRGASLQPVRGGGADGHEPSFARPSIDELLES